MHAMNIGTTMYVSYVKYLSLFNDTSRVDCFAPREKTRPAYTT